MSTIDDNPVRDIGQQDAPATQAWHDAGTIQRS